MRTCRLPRRRASGLRGRRLSRLRRSLGEGADLPRRFSASARRVDAGLAWPGLPWAGAVAAAGGPAADGRLSFLGTSGAESGRAGGQPDLTGRCNPPPVEKPLTLRLRSRSAPSCRVRARTAVVTQKDHACHACRPSGRRIPSSVASPTRGPPASGGVGVHGSRMGNHLIEAFRPERCSLGHDVRGALSRTDEPTYFRASTR